MWWYTVCTGVGLAVFELFLPFLSDSRLGATNTESLDLNRLIRGARIIAAVNHSARMHRLRPIDKDKDKFHIFLGR
ncbi:hypothetical protein BC939DRAFT_454861 [Gamsiella multidivaricata]|uniref:uncharacterized protein n=1 Tax=Gamsiella multidivaricata TaxID=101098 RepID=UPI00221EC103|nr:uncharacterized protein BC939DRAFT_454861 [Gamsiella multidivaricata]KAI7821904.1 hypothetical protein BC939DRAFT_454861 [Gamsiella multidivaricata]